MVDDDTFVALRHHSGVTSHLWMSALAAQAGPRLRVLGSDGAYVKHGLDPQEDELRAGRVPGPAADWGAEPKEMWGLLGTDSDHEQLPTLPGDYPAFYRQLADAMATGASVPVLPSDAVACLRIIESARQSARAQTVIALDA
jgi:scyllo-inositol 2-dehydrogenase (NADP+)